MAQRSAPSSDPTAAGGVDRAYLVLEWAAAHGRDLPWRHTRDPWAVLVSEVMSQQTQVERVVPKWLAFLERWPTAPDCADAPLGDVLRLWEGLGYPRRAKHLHQAAGQITTAGVFPSTLDGLLGLAGVGPYTARAVMAFAFEADVAVVDTNTARILARWVNRPLGRTEVQSAADVALPPGNGWAWNQAMLDLGALVCVRRAPRCSICPVFSTCTYGQVVRVDPTWPDPADGTAGVSVRQPPFGGSDRQVRGQILRAAGNGSGVERSEIASAIGMPEAEDRITALIDALLAEGLLESSGTRVHLPGVG